MKLVNVVPIIFAACVGVAYAQSADAAGACPVSLYSGNSDHGTISITFKNQGKIPIRQLELFCSPLHDKRSARIDCHTATGVFYPGTPFTLRFPYPGTMPHAIEVSEVFSVG